MSLRRFLISVIVGLLIAGIAGLIFLDLEPQQQEMRDVIDNDTFE